MISTLCCLLLASCQQQNRHLKTAIFELTPVDSFDVSRLKMYLVNSIVLHDSTLFISSTLSKTIVKTTLRFEPLAQFRMRGRGPFDLEDVSDLAVSEHHLYAIDFKQRKLVEFTHDLVPISEILSDPPPLSILAVKNRLLWLGSFDLAFEDVYVVDVESGTFSNHGSSISTDLPMEGLVFHAKNSTGDILRYRQFNHRLDLFQVNGRQQTFYNKTQPKRPLVVERVPGYPLFEKKIHHSAFLTSHQACVLSGNHSQNNQPVQCFDFTGELVAQYRLRQDPSLISVYTDSTLFTYSQLNNYIYVYHLGF
jgi:hypothetical protein